MFMHGFSLNEKVGQYPCFVIVTSRVLTQTSQLLNIQLFLMFEFLGTHGHLLHTWHVPKYSLHGYNSPHRPSFQLPACMLMWFFRTWYFITVCHLRSEWGKTYSPFNISKHSINFRKMADIIIAFIFDNLSQVIKKLL